MDLNDGIHIQAIEATRELFPTYAVVKHIGSGNFGEVYEVESESYVRALKVVRMNVKRIKNKPDVAAMSNQLSSDYNAVKAYYQRIKGPGVIEVYDFHLKKKIYDKIVTGLLLILMEKYPYNLTDYVLDTKPDINIILMHLTTLSQILCRLCDGKDSFLVTDLKPDNLLLTDSNELVIGDLGGIKSLGSIMAGYLPQIDQQWLAPEVFYNRSKFDLASVIFSYGLVGYFMLEEELPFGDELDPSSRLEALRERGPIFNKQLPSHVQHLITSCLANEPNQRPLNFAHILQMIQERSCISLQTPLSELQPQGTFTDFGPSEEHPSPGRKHNFDNDVLKYKLVSIPSRIIYYMNMQFRLKQFVIDCNPVTTEEFSMFADKGFYAPDNNGIHPVLASRIWTMPGRQWLNSATESASEKPYQVPARCRPSKSHYFCSPVIACCLN